MLDLDDIPADFPVRPIKPNDPTAKDPCTCGTCGLTWDDAVPTSWTPAPSARCPFEYFHEDEEDEERTVYQTDHEATIAKVEQLIADAYAKEQEGGRDRAYWTGVGFGLRRALNVIRGNG